MEVQYDTVYHTKRNVVFLQCFIDSHAINTAGVHSHPFQQISKHPYSSAAVNNAAVHVGEQIPTQVSIFNSFG